MTLRELIEEIKKINATEQHRLKEFFLNSIASFSTSQPVIQEITERKNKDGYNCIHCTSKQVVRFGRYMVKIGLKEVERQRYRCKDCRKTSTDVTSTPLYRTHKPDKWLDFIKCMLEGYSVRKSADLLGDVHFVTLFYWRHKVLSALKQMDFETFSGIVEMDETYFLYSQKGKRNIEGRNPRKRGGSSKFRGISHEQVCVLIARDRQKATYSGVLGRGRIVKAQLDMAIGSKLSSDNTLCTDAWRAFSTYAMSKGLKHYRFKSDGKERVKGIYHIQNANNYQSRLKGWIQRLNGVATKYLDHYLIWFDFLEKDNQKSDKSAITKTIVESCLFSKNETYESIRTYKW